MTEKLWQYLGHFFVLALLPVLFGCNGRGTILEEIPSSEFLGELKNARVEASVTFLEFSDLHGSKENLGMIVEFYQAYGEYVDEAIHLGDVVACYLDDENPMTKVKGAERILNTVGNHDCWKSHKVWAETNFPYDATKEEAYGKILEGPKAARPLVAGWGVAQPEGVGDPASPDYRACYYYKDYPEARLRLIVLDCIHYFDAQDKWFGETLEGALEADYVVVASVHYPPVKGIDELGEGMKGLTGIDEPEEGQFERMSDRAYDRVDDFIVSGGRFAAWLSGHEHYDMEGLVSCHEPQLVIVTDMAGGENDRFNLVTVNTGKNLITVQKIGERLRGESGEGIGDTSGEELEEAPGVLRYDFATNLTLYD